MHFDKYDHLDVIKSTQQLEEFCHHLLNEETSGFITIDTEFMRRTTYWSQICLIQVAGSKRMAIIDPLDDTLDLSSFYEVLKADRLVKVFHAARQDLELFYHLMGELPHPIFDTQVAAMVCGYGDSIGYSNLVEEILKLTIDKSQRFTDWSVRPLKQKQLKYAIQDVTHLRQIYEELLERLQSQKRKMWIEQEMSILIDPKTYQINKMELWKKIKIRNDNPRFLARMQYLAAVREDLAMDLDRPRGHIATDADLLLLAADPPESVAEMRAIKSLQISKDMAEKFLEGLKKAEEIPPEQCPRRERVKIKPKHTMVIEVLKLWLKQVAFEENVATKLIASTDDLEIFVTKPSKDLPLMHGWRYKIFGRHALDLMNGEKSLKIEKGKLVMVD